MHRQSAYLSIILACHPDLPAPPTAPAVPAQQHPAAAAPAPDPVAVPPPPSGPLPPVVDEIDRDLDHMIGGQFAADHLGLDLYNAIVARAEQQAAAYAGRLAVRHAERARSDLRYADLHIAATLARLHPHAPERVEMSAREFYQSFTHLLQQPAIDERQTTRIRQQQALVHTLAGGLDRPLPTPPNPVKNFDRVCVTPTPNGQGLTPELTCACGDQLACKLTATSATLDLAVHHLPSTPMCDDCYPTWTTCTVPALPPGATIRLTHATRTLGTLTVTADGRLPPNTCLPTR